MSDIELRVKLSESIYYGVKAFCEKYGVTIDDAVAELLSRALLSEFFGILLVPYEKLRNAKGVAVLSEREDKVIVISRE